MLTKLPRVSYSTGWTLTDEGTIEPEVRAYIAHDTSLTEDLKEVLNPIISKPYSNYYVNKNGTDWKSCDYFSFKKMGST